MIQIEIDTAVINDVYIKHMDNMARTQIFYGGSSSGKSVFLAQRDLVDVLRGGRNFLICRQVARTLRKSVFAEIAKLIVGWGLSHLFKINKTELTITCENGYQLLFAGLDDVQKLKSITPALGVITDIRVEEATETAQNSIKQLIKRQRGGDATVPKRLTLSFNPILQSHWMFKEYFAPLAWSDDQTVYASPELSIQKTWYIHNKFLTQDDIDDLENETDKYYYDVYSLGNWGVLGNVIFKNYHIKDLSKMHAQFTQTKHGVDWGFGSDPFAYNQTWYDQKKAELYIISEVNILGASDEETADLIRPYAEAHPVVCDSSEPKSIAKYRNLRINAYGARKGKGSIQFGYKWLASQTIYIDPSCTNTINEFQMHKWKEDRYGVALAIPEDKNNHHIDEIRYQYENESLQVHNIKNVFN